MKGIILAGGTGSRLLPLTKVTNKHLLPVGDKPMVLHPVGKLVEAGITEILLVTGVEHMGDVVSLLGSGKEFGCRFTYKVQDEAGGIAQALALAEEFAYQSKMAVILGDNIFDAELGPYVERFEKQAEGARVLVSKVEDPERFGVADIKDNKIVRILEKPQTPPSNLAVTGLYFYEPSVFEIIKTLRPSGRGELEISDVNNAYISDNKLEYEILDGRWTDAGTFESYHYANRLLFEK